MSNQLTSRGLLTGAIAATLLAAASVGLTTESVGDRPATSAVANPSLNFRHPSANCSNANCHGGVRGSASNTADTVWNASDPHAQAYRLLWRDVSLTIVEKLNGGKLPSNFQQFVDTQCAACHAAPASRELAESDEHLRTDFGCSACHGPADNWLETHFTTSAPQLSSLTIVDSAWVETNTMHGLRDLNDQVTRARTCVGCHVGLPGGDDSRRRDVDHDLIAAGHPRLAFEYTSHLANLPPHWESNDSLDRARQWLIGQLVAFDASLDLLVARAESGVWPEFAEYSCASCHHTLQNDDGNRAFEPFVDKGRDLLSWNAWYRAAIPTDVLSPSGQTLLGELTTELSKLNPPKQEVRQLAQSLRDEVRRSIDRFKSAESKLDWAKLAANLRSTTGSTDWELAAQHYLFEAHRLEGNPTANEKLQELYETLHTTPQQNGPRWMRSSVATPTGISKRRQQLSTLQPASP